MPEPLQALPDFFPPSDPRNAGRKDLGCPFGCKEAHRKRQSTRRSVEYYRGEAGQMKKAIQNGQRQAPGRVAESKPETAARWDGPMVEQVRRGVSLIEGRRVGTGEILEMLARVLRQHRLVRRRRIDHSIEWLNKNPP